MESTELRISNLLPVHVQHAVAAATRATGCVVYNYTEDMQTVPTKATDKVGGVGDIN